MNTYNPYFGIWAGAKVGWRGGVIGLTDWGEFDIVGVIMEDIKEAEVQEQTQVRTQERVMSSFLAGLNIPLKVILSVVLTLAGVYSAIAAVMCGIAMVFASVGILYIMIERPGFGIVSFAFFLLSTVSYLVICVLSFRFVYTIFRKREIERKLLIVFGVCIVLLVILGCVVSPMVGATLDEMTAF